MKKLTILAAIATTLAFAAPAFASDHEQGERCGSVAKRISSDDSRDCRTSRLDRKDDESRGERRDDDRYEGRKQHERNERHDRDGRRS